MIFIGSVAQLPQNQKRLDPALSGNNLHANMSPHKIPERKHEANHFTFSY